MTPIGILNIINEEHEEYIDFETPISDIFPDKSLKEKFIAVIKKINEEESFIVKKITDTKEIKTVGDFIAKVRKSSNENQEQ